MGFLKGVSILKKLNINFKHNEVIFLIFMLLFIFSSVFVYANKDMNYAIESLEVELLFESEQEILNQYSLDIATEDIPLEISDEVVEENSVENTEQMTIDCISELKIVEYKEEYQAKDRLEKNIVPMEVSDSGYVWPVYGYTKVSSPYGWRNCTFHGREFHSGIDVPAPEYTPVLASKDGIIVLSEYSKSYGNYMIIQHSDGDKTLYAHLIERYYNVGAEVTQGTVIGGVGSTGSSTGNHLHYEVWMGADTDSRINPMDCY